MATIADARRYTWDSNGRRLAYVTGNYSENRFGFTPTGTWTYDISSGHAQRIYEGGWDVHWAPWENIIYIYDLVDENAVDAQVLRFHPVAGDLFLTFHEGIHFSPDGQYYFVQGHGADPLRVFRTDTDANLEVVISTEPDNRTRIAGSARGWLDEDTLIVPSPDPNEAGDYLLDVEAGTIRYATGAVIPERSHNGRLLILEGASVIERPRNELALVQDGPGLEASEQ